MLFDIYLLKFKVCEGGGGVLFDLVSDALHMK
jgi:hypothetical protein